MATIYGELVGQDTLVVLAGGLAAPEDIALAAKRLKALTPLFEKSDPAGALITQLTWPAVVQLAQTFGPNWVPSPRLAAWIADQVMVRTTPHPLSFTPPAPLVPYPWQFEGAGMIAATGRVLITDEPGTGKTITTILGLVEWASRRHTEGPVLVICPASVIDAWVEAWRNWAPHVRAIAWRGAPLKRRELAGTADVYVCSYETARIDAPAAGPKSMKPLLNLGAAAVVVDECHLIKNNQTGRSQAVRRLAHKADSVVCLSGTPITHHPGDLWASLDALEHGAWPAKKRWVDRYCQVVPGEYDEEILGLLPAAEPEFRLTLLGQHRRVAKADVLSQLPPKVYSVRSVELPTSPKGGWRKVYDDFEAQMLAELPDGSELQVMDLMSRFTHLSRLASAAADVEVTIGPDVDERTGMPKRHVSLNLKAPSWKVDALLEVLQERPGQPVVCFAPSAQLVQLAGKAAAEAGLRVGYVVGGQAPADRTRAVAEFQSGDLDLLCATTGAGGVGLTLTAARTVVFLQRPWSLVESIQAEDRCHRIGSEVHDSIEVIDVVARNTLDTRIRAVLRERAGQLADLVQDPRIVATLLGGAEHALQPERKAS
jgi:SNF2 family DNA or RNA helicase